MIGLKAMRCIGALTLALVATIAMAAPAMAACGVDGESVAKAEVVFVGTLTEVSADGRNATFEVEAVWRDWAHALGRTVALDTTNSLMQLALPPPDVPPERYLVLAQTVDGQLHTGDSCEIFPFPWDASYAAFRPVDAPSAGDSPTAGVGLPGAVLAVGAALLVLSVVGVVAFSRGRATDA